MVITLNKKIDLEFFENFFGGFRRAVSKLMRWTVYIKIFEDTRTVQKISNIRTDKLGKMK